MQLSFFSTHLGNVDVEVTNGVLLEPLLFRLFTPGFGQLTNPVALLGNDKGAVKEARCVKMELGEPDAKGRRKPRPIPGSEFTIPVDVLLIAFGFDPKPDTMGT